MIEIISPTRIEVDGKDAGLPGDWLAADLSRLAAFNAAMIEWHRSHVTACQTKDADVAAAITATQAELREKTRALEAAQEEAAAAIEEEKASLIAQHDAERARLEADIATLGTKPEAIAIRKAQERTRKLEQLAALQAELRIDDHADLEAVDAPGAIP